MQVRLLPPLPFLFEEDVSCPPTSRHDVCTEEETVDRLLKIERAVRDFVKSIQGCEMDEATYPTLVRLEKALALPPDRPESGETWPTEDPTEPGWYPVEWEKLSGEENGSRFTTITKWVNGGWRIDLSKEEFKELLNRKQPLAAEIAHHHILMHNIEDFTKILAREYYGKHEMV